MTMKTLEELLEYLDNVPDINSGGCAIAALVIHRWLKQRRLKSEIVFGYSFWNQNLRRNEDVKNGKTKVGGSCTHAQIKQHKQFLDSGGFYKKPSHTNFHILPEDVVVKAINNIGEWNDEFDRRRIKDIQSKTGVNLHDIKISPRRFCPLPS